MNSEMRICDMPIGATGWTVPWGFYTRSVSFFDKPLLFVRGDYHCLENSFGTATVQIKRTKETVVELLTPLSSRDRSHLSEMNEQLDWKWMQVMPYSGKRKEQEQ